MTFKDVERAVLLLALGGERLPDAFALNQNDYRKIWQSAEPLEIKVPATKTVPLCTVKVIFNCHVPDGVIMARVNGQWEPFCLPEPKEVDQCPTE